MNKVKLPVFLFILISFCVITPVIPVKSCHAAEIPVKGMVTMVDLGAKKCIPCKMMAPILNELENEYQGRAAIRFIDVWERPDEARRFGIRTIPTQIFYDINGKEVARHIGFMAKEDIIDQLKKMGVD